MYGIFLASRVTAMKKIILAALFLIVSSTAFAQSVNLFLLTHDASNAMVGNNEVNQAINNAARPDVIKPLDPMQGKKGILRNKSRYFASTVTSEDVTLFMREKTESYDNRMNAQARSLFAKTDVERLFDTIYRPMGLQQNDLADAAAAYWIMMWAVGNQKMYPPTAQVQKIRHQVYDSLSAGGMLKLPDSQKQKVAQVFMWKAILLYMAYQDPRMDQRQLAALVSQKASNTGFEFNRTLLTQEGFLLPKTK
jgi:hypothetical protein